MYVYFSSGNRDHKYLWGLLVLICCFLDFVVLLWYGFFSFVWGILVWVFFWYFILGFLVCLVWVVWSFFTGFCWLGFFLVVWFFVVVFLFGVFLLSKNDEFNLARNKHCFTRTCCFPVWKVKA